MDRPSDPGDLDRRDRFLGQLAPLVYALAHRLHAHFVTAAEELGLPPPLAKALHSLEPGAPRPMNELAGALGCDPSNITGIADRLEAHGLVERHPAAHDRRVKELVVTPAGAALRALFLRRLDEVPVAVDALADDERATLLALLRRLVDGMRPPADAGPGDRGCDSESGERRRHRLSEPTATRAGGAGSGTEEADWD